MQIIVMMTPLILAALMGIEKKFGPTHLISSHLSDLIQLDVHHDDDVDDDVDDDDDDADDDDDNNACYERSNKKLAVKVLLGRLNT